MGSLVKVFEMQSKVWKLGKAVSVYIYPQNNTFSTENNNKQELKRPASPFALFFQSKQSVLRKQNPHLRQPEIMKLASDMWKRGSPLTQQQHKKEFDSKMEEYRLNIKEVPKRPRPPFIQFFSDKSSTLQYQYPNVLDRAKKASQMWKDLSLVEKQRYKAAYANQLNNFKENLSEKDSDLIQERKDTLNNKRKQRDVRRYGKEALKERPKTPITNPFIMFVQKKASEIPANSNVMKYLGEQWRNMSAAQKMLYQEEVKNAVKTYEKDLIEWKKKHDKFPQK